VIKFLHGCSFTGVRELSLRITLRNTYAVQSLAEFLGGLTLRRLHFNSPLDEQNQARLIPHFRADSLYVLTSTLGPAFADHLPPSVHDLYMMYFPVNFEAFWAFLDHLVLARHQRRLGIRNIIMSEWPMPSWIEADPGPEFVEDLPHMFRLLRYAAALSKCGINFRDNHAKRVTQYFA
jgi:hypothetical protein